MVSFLILDLFAFCIALTSGACPYVANYYYAYPPDTSGGSYTSSSYSSGGAWMMNHCQVEDNTAAGVDYQSEKFVCINNEPFMTFYTGESCQGTPGETMKVESVSDYEEERSELQFSCDDTGCTNYAQILLSQTAYDSAVEAINSGQSASDLQCTDPGTDDWFDVYGFKFVTDVCVDSTGNSSQPISSRKWTCDDSGFTAWQYTGNKDCQGAATEMGSGPLEGCIELAPGVEIWGKVNCGAVTGDAITPSPIDAVPSTSPTEKPTISPTDVTSAPSESPSVSPTESSGSPSAAPTGGSGTPTAAPSDAPSTPSVPPSANPSVSPSAKPSETPSVAPTAAGNFASGGVPMMTWKNICVMVVMAAINMLLY